MDSHSVGERVELTLDMPPFPSPEARVPKLLSTPKWPTNPRAKEQPPRLDFDLDGDISFLFDPRSILFLAFQFAFFVWWTVAWMVA